MTNLPSILLALVALPCGVITYPLNEPHRDVIITGASPANESKGIIYLVGQEPPPGATLNYSSLNEDICGRRTIDRLAYGKKTDVFAYPWMVILLYETNYGLEDRCAGTLINNRYVLTAAHCVKKSSLIQLTKVRLGEHDRSTPKDCTKYASDNKCADEAYDVEIEEVIIHKDYNKPIKNRHDIALIRMAREIAYSKSVRPTCLPKDQSLDKSNETIYILTGWGTTELNEPSDVLLEAILYPLAITECKENLIDNFVRVDIQEPWQMCAIGQNMTDSCTGDSGGPIGFFKPQFVQFGIVSFGVNSCGQTSAAGVYTRVAAYMDWIVANVRAGMTRE